MVNTLNIRVGCKGLEVIHYKDGIDLCIEEAEVLDILKYPELADAFKKYAYITNEFRERKL